MLTKTTQITTPTLPKYTDVELQFLELQLLRFGGDGDCAYERALSQLYRGLFEQRNSQLDALRRAGL